MTNKSCPTAVVNAPIDVVWKLLTEPAGWTEFFDIRVTRIDPPGPAVVGQRIHGESGPRFLRLVVTLKYTEIDAARRTIGLNVQLPFGITVRFRRVLAARAVDDGSPTIPSRVECGAKGYLNGGAIGSEDLQRPRRAAANRIDIPDQPFVLLLA
jgi:hypothetical protein